MDDSNGLAPAVELGWRVAELYSRVDDLGAPIADSLLPSSTSLEPADQLELQLRAAAGDAMRCGITSKGASLPDLIACARDAAGSPEGAEAFRVKLRRCHIEIEKDLWALDEAYGKAYELANGLSDTYGRVCRAYRVPGEDPAEAWKQVFAADRVERLKKLMDDLQTKLHPESVAVVKDHLDRWRDAVPARLQESGAPPEGAVREGLRRQTVIWRQLIGGHKAPEAYLDVAARAELRDDLREIVWRRYRKWFVPVAVVLAVLAVCLPQLADWWDSGWLKGSTASVAIALAGAFGITRASVGLTIRSKLSQWSELLWNRAIAEKVVSATLALDAVFPPPPAPEKSFMRDAATRIKGAVAPARQPAHP
jgi:hypothetical protein